MHRLVTLTLTILLLALAGVAVAVARDAARSLGGLLMGSDHPPEVLWQTGPGPC